MKLRLYIILFLLLSCGNDKKSSSDEANNQLKELSLLAKKAYLFGYPLMYTETLRDNMASASGVEVDRNKKIPISCFIYRDITNKNIYSSISWVDLTMGPVVVDVPDMVDQYYFMRLTDGWSNVQYTIGTRTIGNNSHKFVMTGPDWKGYVPPNLRHYKMTTNTTLIISQISVKNYSERYKVTNLLHKVRITTLADQEYGHTPWITLSAVKGQEPKFSVRKQLNNMPLPVFIAKLNTLLLNNPYPKKYEAIIRKFNAVGVAPGYPFEWNGLDPNIKKAIIEGVNEAKKEIQDSKRTENNAVDEWSGPYADKFNVNYLPFFNAEFNKLEEKLLADAGYFCIDTDDSGQTLTGRFQYKLHFEKNSIPPSNAFWNISVLSYNKVTEKVTYSYTLSSYDNLKLNTDGSFDIYLQSFNEESTNTIPTPKGNFIVILRLYWPDNVILKKEWMPPIITALNNY